MRTVIAGATVAGMRKRPATIDLGPWPYPKGPRVLIEHPDPDDALELAIAIRNGGCTVGICRGPQPRADRPTRCPLHGLEPCVAVEGADLVVTVLDLSEAEGREVVRGLRTRYSSTPLVVAATVAQMLDLGAALDGCRVVQIDARPDEIAATVLDGLAETQRPKGER